MLLHIDESERDKKFKGKNILLAEDDSIDRQILKGKLENFGVTVTPAENGLIALNFMKEKNLYDLILMDIQLPIIDGLLTSKLIRQLDNGKSIPIIALTENTDIKDRTEFSEAAIDDVLIKPIDSENLSQVLVKWIKTLSPLKNSITDDGNVDFYNHLLTSQNGYDISQIKKIFGSNLDRYYKLVKTFILKYNDTIQTVISKVMSGDYLSAREDIHRFSGAAGTLGLNHIYVIAKEIEPLLLLDNVNENSIIKLLTKLNTTYDHFTNNISKVEKVSSDL